MLKLGFGLQQYNRYVKVAALDGQQVLNTDGRDGAETTRIILNRLKDQHRKCQTTSFSEVGKVVVAEATVPTAAARRVKQR